MKMEKEKAWKRFSESGAIADYLEFRNCVANSLSGVKANENEYRRTGSQGNGYGGK
jgi:hypothetical protein